MATSTIAWNSGSGNITLTYTGQGNSSVSVASDANDSFDAREQYVTVKTSAGSPQVTRQVLVKQKGKTIPAGTVYNLDYTGTVQEVTLPPGRYKLQCWGAQGGSVSGSYTANGSKGGYSEGVLVLTAVTTLYIFVGGKGTDSSTSSTSGTANGGWNGGGGSVRQSSYNSSGTYGVSYPRPGGGATDIALVSSDMAYSSYRNNRSAASLLSRIIVAGGGAGASAHYTEVTTTTTTPERVDIIYSNSNTTCVYDTSIDPNLPYIFPASVYLEAGYKYKFIARQVSGSFQSSSRTYRTLFPNGTVLNGREFTATISGTYYFAFCCNYNEPTLVFSCTVEKTIPAQSSTSTSTSSGQSNAAQQGGGTSGLGTSPGTQNSGGGEFGKGVNQTTTGYRYDSGGGGGGWYGGGSSYSDSDTSAINKAGGGSGFVNTAANAGYRPSGYTGLQLESGETKAGNTSFPSTGGGTETGHSGNGYARITVL